MFSVRKNKVLTIAAAVALLLALSLVTFAASDSGEGIPFVPVYTEGSYGEYLQNHIRDTIPTQVVEVDLKNLLKAENVSLETVAGREALLSHEDSDIEFEVNVPVTGMYCLGVSYYQIAGSGSSIERSVTINDEYPFTEAHSIGLDRIYQDDVEDTSNKESYFSSDDSGNQVRKSQVESPRWVDNVAFRDSSSTYNGYLKFYLEKGRNVIRLSSIRGSVAFSRIYLFGQSNPVSYGEFYLDNAFLALGGSNLIETVQAETPDAKNTPMLFASYDRASSATQPPSLDTIKLNTMGGNTTGDPRWSIPGQWVEYKVNVDTEGLYKIVMRARQNILNGGFVSREISVNGEVQFEEASYIKIPYSSDWQMVSLADDYGQPLLFHLEKGENTIRINAVTGDMGDIINGVSAVITKLNADYRKILMLTGSSPDAYRDYKFDEEIPEVVADLKAQGDILKSIHDELVSILGGDGQISATLKSIYTQLYDMHANPDTIAESFNSFQTNITNLSEWQQTVQSQPMELDYILIAEENYEVPSGNNNFFQEAWFQIKMFFASFFTDFNKISTVGAETYTEEARVWTMGARDQAQVMRTVIDRSFIPEYKINLNLELVPGGALLPSILAGIGPDVVLSIGSTDVINYASRNALEPLNDYANFEEIKTRFSDSAFVPVTLEREIGKSEIFGLPEAQSFSVLVYRTDIMSELGRGIPQTWDDVYELIPVMQKRYMDFAPPDYTTLLYQNGGQYYKDRGQSTDIDSEVAINTFIQQTDFYTLYKLPISYSFQNRFRNGEMPVGMSDLYGFYNMMAVFAPELKGLWSFTEVPGTVKEDGTIDRSVVTTVSSCVMLANAKNKENAWKFMSWWTDTEAQTDFGLEIESVLGAAGRYNSANKEAVKNLNWTKAELDVIMAQWENVIGYPEMPGGYMLSRELGFATTSVIVDYEDPRETLLDVIKPINEELINKRRELGLPLDMVESDED